MRDLTPRVIIRQAQIYVANMIAVWSVDHARIRNAGEMANLLQFSRAYHLQGSTSITNGALLSPSKLSNHIELLDLDKLRLIGKPAMGSCR